MMIRSKLMEQYCCHVDVGIGVTSTTAYILVENFFLDYECHDKRMIPPVAMSSDTESKLLGVQRQLDINLSS